MARFKTNPWELDQLLSILDSCKLVLPEFQRSFVWRATDIDLLLTSLVQDFPAGSLLFLRAGAAEQELAWRPVEGAKTDGQVTPDYLVLDGQQRLTSLSLALNGRGEHLFFMDLRLLDQGDYESGIYPLRRNKAKQRGLLDKETQWATHTYPVSAALGEGQDEFWFEDYIEYQVAQGADRDETKERARRLRQSFVKPLREYAFPVVELPADTSLEAVCQIFETLNKTGMKLTVFDLLTAKFWPQGLNLRAKLEQARSDYPLLGEDGFDVEATYLLQAMALLRTGLCKRGDLLQLKRENFEEDWESVCAAASAALGMLRGECGVIVRHWLPYAALFPALFSAATKVHQLKGPEVGAGWEKLRRWFWCSCFGQRYDGPPNTLNAQDFKALTSWFVDDDAVPEAVAEFKLSDINLRRTDRQRAALYRAVICLTVVNGARDFYTGQRLTPDILNDPNRRIEDHHIVPTGWLKKQTPAREGENAVLNRCLIDYLTNKLISDKAPSTYLAEIETKLGADKLDAVLESHLIPAVGAGNIRNDDLDTFLNARERMLIEAIAAVSGAPLNELSGGETYLDPTRPFMNELALLGVIRGLHGRVFWYEQHMGRKALEPLAEELDRERVREVCLLSGPANINPKAKRAFERFAQEMANDGINCDWRVLPAGVAGDLHARVLFDTSSAWELPPLNSLLKGTVDSIRPSQIPRSSFEEAWQREDALPLLSYQPEDAGASS